MLLAIDCGNTNTVFSVWDGERFVATLRTSTEHQRTADQYFVWWDTLTRHHGITPEITGVVISSTVPRVVFNLRVFTDRYFGLRPLVVGKPDCLLPIDVRVDAGTQVGPDRLVNTVAGYGKFGGDLIVVDFGTATTFDYISKEGAYMGGAIAPGVIISCEALFQEASKLPRVEIFTRPKTVIAKDTVSSMNAGIIFGYAGLVDGIVNRIRKESGEAPMVIATGGLAPLIAEVSETIHHVEEFLTLQGLIILFNRNP